VQLNSNEYKNQEDHQWLPFSQLRGCAHRRFMSLP
jgi:hypothetical protein